MRPNKMRLIMIYDIMRLFCFLKKLGESQLAEKQIFMSSILSRGVIFILYCLSITYIKFSLLNLII